VRKARRIRLIYSKLEVCINHSKETRTSKLEGLSAKFMGPEKARRAILGECPMNFLILSSIGICCRASNMGMRTRLFEWWLIMNMYIMVMVAVTISMYNQLSRRWFYTLVTVWIEKHESRSSAMVKDLMRIRKDS
jgi:hypothetical protein